MSLLYLASQLGRNISKFSLVDSEYLRAISVNGQNILNQASTRPSITTNPIAIHTHASILFMITAYNK